MKTQGVLKEDEMIFFLNNRKIKELSTNLYHNVKEDPHIDF